MVLRGKDVYCQQCLMISVQHKMRATLGKHKGNMRNFLYEFMNSIKEFRNEFIKLNSYFSHQARGDNLGISEWRSEQSGTGSHVEAGYRS